MYEYEQASGAVDALCYPALLILAVLFVWDRYRTRIQEDSRCAFERDAVLARVAATEAEPRSPLSPRR